MRAGLWIPALVHCGQTTNFVEKWQILVCASLTFIHMLFSSSFDESQAYSKDGFWFSQYLHFQAGEEKKKSAIDEIARFLKMDFKNSLNICCNEDITKKWRAKPNEDIQKWRDPRSLEEDAEQHRAVHISFSCAGLYNS